MNRPLIAILAALAPLVAARACAASPIPKATQKAVDGLKLDASVLDGLDAELAAPQAMIDGAKAEKDVVIAGTWTPREFQDMVAPFKERYPFVNLRYQRAGASERGSRVLVALDGGRALADVMTSIGDAIVEFNAAKALADLRGLPGFANIDPLYSAADGTWTSHKVSYRCMAYNTDKVKKDELPATWDDLIRDPRWRGGELALTNNPNTWMLGLWGTFGDAWGEKFTRDLFETVQPQRRKEGLTALTALAVAGEFTASLPSPEWVAQRYASKGAPLSYHCPSPVPTDGSQIAVLEKAPHPNAARLFVNWMISREGQISQYAATLAVPVHKALRSAAFTPFADTIVGKPTSPRGDALLTSETNAKMGRLWDRYWNAAAK
jgi:iron(III) transport system substrate-binding protein